MLSSKAFFRFGNEFGKLLRRKAAAPSLKCSISTRNLPSTYGGRHTVTLIPADGIGPALIGGMRDVFVAAGVPIDFHEAHLEGRTPEERNASFEEVLMSVRRNGVAVKG